MKEKLRCQKHLFSLPEDLHYLNGAAASPLSKAVEAAGFEGVKMKSVPTRVSAENYFERAFEVRGLFAKLINAEAKRIALIPAVSYGIATVVKNLKLIKGQNIVLLHQQFPSNVLGWQRFQEQGIELKTVHPTATPNRGEAWNEKILECIDQNTAVVALPTIHWADGTRFDLESIALKAKSVGAALIIDGTQSVGAMPFDIQKIQPDALFVTGYKWLMGVYGMSCAYYGPRFDGGMPLEESHLTRDKSGSFEDLVSYSADYVEGAERFDVSQKHNPILLPMLSQGLQDVLERDPKRIQEYCHDLTKNALEELVDAGYTVEGSRWRSKHLFGLKPPKALEVADLKTLLDSKNITVTPRGDVLRISPNVYNDARDMDALKQTLLEETV